MKICTKKKFLMAKAIFLMTCCLPIWKTSTVSTTLLTWTWHEKICRNHYIFDGKRHLLIFSCCFNLKNMHCQHDLTIFGIAWISCWIYNSLMARGHLLKLMNLTSTTHWACELTFTLLTELVSLHLHYSLSLWAFLPYSRKCTII